MEGSLPFRDGDEMRTGGGRCGVGGVGGCGGVWEGDEVVREGRV